MMHPDSAVPAAGAEPAWTTVIQPKSGWFDWNLRELWRYRDLVSLLVWRDFVAYYKQTILGPAWHIIQPLVTTLTFTLIFGRVAGISTNGSPPFLFYMAGNVAWAYFANCLTNTSVTFVKNAPLLGKVYFHRLAIPVAVVISALIAFGIQFVMFLGFLLVYAIQGTPIPLRPEALLTPVWVLMLAGFGLGGGIVVSALTTRYRDLAHAIGFGVQLILYASPVIYPSSALPERYRWLAWANPLSPVIESFRAGFLGGDPVPATHLAFSAFCLVLVIGAGLALFAKVERTFMDTI